MTSDNVDMRRSWASLAVLCSMFADISRIADYKGCHLVNSCVRRLEWGLKVCKDQLDNSLATRSTTWIPSRDDGFKLIHTRDDESGSVAALRWRMPPHRGYQITHRYRRRIALRTGIKRYLGFRLHGRLPRAESGHFLSEQRQGIVSICPDCTCFPRNFPKKSPVGLPAISGLNCC